MSTSSDFLLRHAIEQIMKQLRTEYESKGEQVPSEHQLRILAEDRYKKSGQFRK